MPANQLKLSTVEYWELDTELLPPESRKLHVRVELAGSDPSGNVSSLEATTELSLIDAGRAASGELARVSLHRSHEALDAGDFDKAIQLAEEAIAHGPADPYDLASLHSMICTACEANGDLKAALQACQEAKRIAEEHFPGRSPMAALMQAAITRIQDRLESEEE